MALIRNETATEPHRKGRFDAQWHGKAGIDLIRIDWSRLEPAKQGEAVQRIRQCAANIGQAPQRNCTAALNSAAQCNGIARIRKARSDTPGTG